MDALFWHWSWNWAAHINHRLTGFNEVMDIVYLLAIASPTHPVPANLYSGWAGQSEAAVETEEAGAAQQRQSLLQRSHLLGIELDVAKPRSLAVFTHYSYMGFEPLAHSRTATRII